MAMSSPERIFINPNDVLDENVSWSILEFGDYKHEYIRADWNGWQPIETAPKDGTWIMVYAKLGPIETVDLTHWVVRWRYDGGWMDQDDVLVLNKNQATHWKPLPTPPKQQDRK